MIYISLGHTFLYSGTAPAINPFRTFVELRDFWHRFVNLALYFVDVFFLISGFLLAYLCIADMSKKHGKIN